MIRKLFLLILIGFLFAFLTTSVDADQRIVVIVAMGIFAGIVFLLVLSWILKILANLLLFGLFIFLAYIIASILYPVLVLNKGLTTSDIVLCVFFFIVCLGIISFWRE